MIRDRQQGLTEEEGGQSRQADSEQTSAFSRLSSSFNRQDEGRGVSPKAMQRLEIAKDAINYAKSVLEFGAGNQISAFRETRSNSYERLRVVRDRECWVVDESVRDLVEQDPDAYLAARIMLAKGGACSEHATLVYQYLRVRAKGEMIYQAYHSMQHAFCLIGDVRAEDPSEIAVADAWPTNPTAVLWDDFFGFAELGTDELMLTDRQVADGKATAEVIAAGLSLTEEGERRLLWQRTPEQTEAAIDKGKGVWLWNQEHTGEDGPVSYTTEE